MRLVANADTAPARPPSPGWLGLRELVDHQLQAGRQSPEWNGLQPEPRRD